MKSGSRQLKILVDVQLISEFMRLLWNTRKIKNDDEEEKEGRKLADLHNMLIYPLISIAIFSKVLVGSRCPHTSGLLSAYLRICVRMFPECCPHHFRNTCPDTSEYAASLF